MFQVKNKDNKTGAWFTSKEYPSQLFFQYKEKENKAKQKKPEKLENFSGFFVTFQDRPTRRRRI